MLSSPQKNNKKQAIEMNKHFSEIQMVNKHEKHLALESIKDKKGDIFYTSDLLAKSSMLPRSRNRIFHLTKG